MQNAHRIAQALDEMATLLRLSGEPKFKVKAYANAARLMEMLGEELGARVERGDLRSLPGIGVALSKQIAELWNTGSSEYSRRLRAEYPEGAAELALVPGMTARRIRTLHEVLGVRSVEDLRDACTAQRVRGIPGFGEKTELRLLAGCGGALRREAREQQPTVRPHGQPRPRGTRLGARERARLCHCGSSGGRRFGAAGACVCERESAV
jgi:DNA polymerase (family X)